MQVCGCLLSFCAWPQHTAAAPQVPGPEAQGSEREIKWGQNIPASGEQAKEELKSVGGGTALG